MTKMYREIRKECVEYNAVEVGGIDVGGGHHRSKCKYSGQICQKDLCPIRKLQIGWKNPHEKRVDLLKKYNLSDDFAEEMA